MRYCQTYFIVFYQNSIKVLRQSNNLCYVQLFLYHRLLETKCIKDFMWAYNKVSEYSGGLGSVEVDLSQDVVCWRSHPLAREVSLQNFEQFSLHRAGMKAHHILVSKGRHNFFLSFFLSFLEKAEVRVMIYSAHPTQIKIVRYGNAMLF